MVYVDADQSQVSVDNTAPAANGTDVVNVFVTAKQNRVGENLEALPFGAGLPANQCVIAVTPSTGVTITQPSAASDANSTWVGSFVTTNAATVSVGATVCGRAVSGNATVVVGGGAPVDPPSGDPFFEDDFAGTQKNNANGFTWSGGPSVVSFDGFNAIRFRYGPDAVGEDSSAEQRFNLGRDCSHLWLEYDLYVPSNFTHRNESPNNNKFAMFWRTTYSDVTGGTWRVGFEYQTGSGTTPNSNIRAMSSRWNLNSWTSSNSTGDYLPTGQNATLISDSGPLNKGAWNTVRIELAAASSQSSSDGIQRMWINGTLFVEITTGKFWNFDTATDPADCFLRNGYFLGYANSGFLDQTDLYITGVKFYDTDPGWI